MFFDAHSYAGSALIVVLAMVVMMTALVVTLFVTVSGERKSSGVRTKGLTASQLASSAPQLIMSQIKDAATSGDAWASQPGMVRTFSTSGSPSRVFKLYSAEQMVVPGAGYGENDDVPPADWNAGANTALFCDLNRPLTRADGQLSYPIANPTAAASSFGSPGEVPGFSREASSIPGFDPAQTSSSTNNPLPMPVRWLYILRNGEMAVPESVDGTGVVSFSSAAAKPDKDNPVVGRLAFWADDDTCKLNINTAGYARNDTSFWTYWDTPIANAQDENNRLSWNQPWTNEYNRYPGHPATTGLNVVFDSLNLTANQTLSLTPRFKDGGTQGGMRTDRNPPSVADISSLKKDERLFASVDEMFYDPDRGANVAGISKAALEARRFLLTTHSRAPETTLFNTPRVTIWPTWQTESKRSALDQLIAFTSTIAGQKFFFVRERPLVNTELQGIAQNLSVWNYLRSLSSQPIPGFGGNFQSKFGAQNLDQILTSIFDAVRLTNLDDRTGPGDGGSTGWSFTAGQLKLNGGEWVPETNNFTQGYVAATDGPNSTKAPGRTAVLGEAALLFARPSDKTDEVKEAGLPVDKNGDGVNDRLIDQVEVASLYGLFVPAAGLVNPGQNREINVSGLSSFRVRVKGTTDPYQQIFPNDTFVGRESDGVDGSRRVFGGRLDWSAGLAVPPIPGQRYGVPPAAQVVLPYGALPSDNPIDFSGGTLKISIYSPYLPAGQRRLIHAYEVTFPPADILTPKPVTDPKAAWKLSDNTTGGTGPHRFAGTIFQEELSWRGDSLIAMQSATGDYRSEILRQSSVASPITDFQPHLRYGKTDSAGFSSSDEDLSRRASSLRWEWKNDFGVNERVNDVLFGRLISGFNNYCYLLNPSVPSRGSITSIQESFPPGDFSNGPGPVTAGSLSPKSDEGAASRGLDTSAWYEAGQSPYFRNILERLNVLDGTLASPNRQISSAVYFGSIPSGNPWRTLLFRPARAFHSGGTVHFGATSPADYLMLDWFHMPVVEPYAISEPLSTAGKININSQIMPFGSYMRRDTALHAILRSGRITAMPEPLVSEKEYALTQRSGAALASNSPAYATRYPINVDETLALIRERFEGTDGSGKRAYLTNAEICSIDLVPEGFTKANLASFWSNKRTTGDNSREAPYSTLLPRLTARSNTFTVHVTAQALVGNQPDGGWREGRGSVASEWRGSFPIERYIDPNDARFDGGSAPDFLSGTISVEPYYKFRLLGETRFDP